MMVGLRYSGYSGQVPKSNAVAADAMPPCTGLKLHNEFMKTQAKFYLIIGIKIGSFPRLTSVKLFS